MSLARIFFGLAGLLFFTIISSIQGRKTLQKIRKIRPCTGDKLIEAKVVAQLPSFISSDIRPILEYEIEGEKKLYEFFSLHRSRAYPLGKVYKLKLSQYSGLAYDRKDLVKGKIYVYFKTGFWLIGIILIIVYIYRLYFT